jgi:pantothenate synthetase
MASRLGPVSPSAANSSVAASISASRVFAAAFLGETRLIDNVPVPETG